MAGEQSRVTSSGVAVAVNVGAVVMAVSIGLVGVGGRGVQVGVADGVIITNNSNGGSIASEARIVDVAFGCEVTHEPAKRETAIAIVTTRFIREGYSCV
jgi:hypothetical protein